MDRIANLQVSVELGTFLYTQLISSKSPRCATLFKKLKILGLNLSLKIAAYFHPRRLDIGFDVRSLNDTKYS